MLERVRYVERLFAQAPAHPLNLDPVYVRVLGLVPPEDNPLVRRAVHYEVLRRLYVARALVRVRLVIVWDGACGVA